MECPFCAEEIKDKAIVCRYCKRDLMYFQAFEARLGVLENQLLETAAHIGQIPIHNSALSKTVPNRLSIWLSLLTILLSVFSTAAIGYVYTLVREQSLLWLFMVTPAVLGFFLGSKYPSIRWKGFLIIGSLIGIFDWVVVTTLLDLSSPSSILYFAIPPSTIFISMVLLGTWFDSKRHPRESTFQITKSPDERWKRFVAKMQPLLPLIGTLISSFFTYLASRRK